MAWQLLAAALPAAAKVAGTYLQKPSREDYKPQTDYMKKYLGYLRGRSAGKEVLHMAMQPQLRAIGRQGREMQRQVGYDVAKTGLTGSGIEAQMRLSAGAQTQEALSEATGKATAAQAAEDARIGEKSADLAARIESEEQRSKQAYEMAGRQWKRQMGAEVLGLGASIAGAGITQAGQAKEAGMLATQSRYFGTAEDVQRMTDEGWTPEMWRQEIARMDKLAGTVFKGSTPEETKRMMDLYFGRDVAVSDVDPALAAAEAGAEAVRDIPLGDYADDTFQETEELLGKRAMGVSEPVAAVEEEAGSVKKLELKKQFEEAGRAKQIELYKRAVESGFKGSIDDWKKSFEEAVKAEVTKKVPPESFAKMMEGIRPVARKNTDGSVSTVKLAQSDNRVYPTIFPKDPDSPTSDPDDWIELEGDAALAEAEKRGEIFELDSEEEARKIAKGSWKPEVKPAAVKTGMSDEEIRDYFKEELGGIDEYSSWSNKAQKDLGRKFGSWQEEYDYYIQSSGKKDVAAIRKKLVGGGHDIVDVTAKTGISSVLAGGKAKIRMAEPLANKFVEAQKLLADKGIEIQVADSLVDYGVKKKQYEEYVAGGEKGARVANPDRSFHTIGFAFDLAQSPEMKRPEVAEALKSVGLIPHDTEWWHWSLEKV